MCSLFLSLSLKIHPYVPFKACEGENVEMVAMLLGFGAGVNKHCIQGWTALHEAVIRNNMEICVLLMKAGAKLSPVNMYGITPLFAAAQTGHAEVLNFLITNGNQYAGLGIDLCVDWLKCR
jgi:ankyrin repeat protein